MANETKAKAAKSRGGKKMVTTAKVTMNFARHKREFNPTKIAIVALVIVVATLLFTKFAILDPLQQKTDALTELSGKQDQMAVLNARLAGWDELQALYGRYSYGWMTEAESGLVDRMEVITILEKIIDKSAVIEDFAINYNILNVNISGLSLDQTSTLVKELEADPQVTSASVYTAKSEDADLNA